MHKGIAPKAWTANFCVSEFLRPTAIPMFATLQVSLSRNPAPEQLCARAVLHCELACWYGQPSRTDLGSQTGHMPWRIAGWRPHASNGIQPDPTIDSLSINNELITEEGAISNMRLANPPGGRSNSSKSPFTIHRVFRKGEGRGALPARLSLELAHKALTRTHRCNRQTLYFVTAATNTCVWALGGGGE